MRCNCDFSIRDLIQVAGEYYANELRQVRKALKMKQSEMLQCAVLQQQNNGPAYTAFIVTFAESESGCR